MRKLILSASAAMLMASVSATGAFAGPVADAMSCHASCSSDHVQCLSDGLDYSLVSSPSEGVERLESNWSVRQECASASAACHSDCG